MNQLMCINVVFLINVSIYAVSGTENTLSFQNAIV